MITWILILRIVTVFVCPQAVTQSVNVEPQIVDATGYAPAAVMSAAGQPAPTVQPVDPQPVIGLTLSPQTITDLMWCIAIGYCPNPGTPLEWGISGN